MNRVGLFLLLAVIACALGVITSQHRARKLFVELEAEQAAAKRLDEEHTQLQIEQGTWATTKRVEAVAARGLAMRTPESSTTAIVKLEGAKP